MKNLAFCFAALVAGLFASTASADCGRVKSALKAPLVAAHNVVRAQPVRSTVHAVSAARPVRTVLSGVATRSRVALQRVTLR
jgi:hypothetical protein